MKIAVLSGKGGTGKTTVATCLATVIPGCQYVDCDVEEPNGHIFMSPQLDRSETVQVLVPKVDESLCTRCGQCAKICQFNAIAVTDKTVLLFPELCHHCGACGLVCPTGAIQEVEKPIGVIESDSSGRFQQGLLNIGEPVGIPIIEAMKQKISPNRMAILDCSPGAACAVVRTIEGCDFALLVTEPTPFGLHDLKVAVSLVRKMGIRAGVVINKSGAGDQMIESYCQSESLEILMKIPFLREIAEHYARGMLPIHFNPEWVGRFKALYWRIGQEVMH